MELLFFWVEKTRVFENQGFVLTPEYDFSMQFVTELNEWQVSIFETDTPNIMRQETISNITAVVGENGAGKTSLFRSILNYSNDFPLNTDESGDMGGVLGIYQDGEELVRRTNIQNLRIIGKQTREWQDSIDDITKIYISNASILNPMVSSSNGYSLNHLILTPDYLDSMADMIFSYTSQYGNGESRNYYLFQRSIKHYFKGWAFQQLATIFYYNSLFHSDQDYAESFVHTKANMRLKPRNIVQMYRSTSDKEEYDKDDQRLIDANQSIIDSVIEKCKLSRKGNALLEKIKRILVIEYQIYQNESINQTTSIDDCYRRIENNPPTAYFLNAKEEISNLEDVLSGSMGMIEEDELVLHYEQEPEVFQGICSYISSILGNSLQQQVDQGGSFLLKYLDFSDLEMSAGERAFHNVFAWLNFVSQMDYISANPANFPRSSILLMIDELDLYAHPEWERRIISELIREIQLEYHSYQVQLIFSTHSPICLCDVPKENTIFLRREGKKSISDDKGSHRQSFATNLYELLDDAFYFHDGTIGEFSCKKMKEWRNQIENVTSYQDAVDLKRKINMIGDVFIREHIMTLLDDKMRGVDNKTDYRKWLIDRQNDIEVKLSELDQND